MDMFSLLKFAHVISAILWLGGGFSMMLLAHLFARRADASALLGVIRQVALLGPRLFMPLSVLTLLTGLGTAHLGGFGWPAWIVLGLAGIAVTALVGALKLGPTCERAVHLADTAGMEPARREMQKLLPFAWGDYAVQFAIVFLMVVKPGWQDLPVLAALGGIVVLALFAAFAVPVRPAARA